MKKRVDVAAAVITRADGSFLLGQRAPGTFYPGYWEFPGGKVEPGEDARTALIRELDEELGIQAHACWPWLMREHDYEHANVRLHFFEVPQYSGEIRDHVHSDLQWQRADALSVSPMLPANGPILKALRLPREMAITQAEQIGIDAQLAAADSALARGVRLIQMREPSLPPADREALARELLARCQDHGALLLINGDIALAERVGADGVHLTEAGLMASSARPDLAWVGASCHSREALEQAAGLGLDYAVLGHVLPTPSHPDRPAIGWSAFTQLTRLLPMPVFAIGGMTHALMSDARAAGAHGIAAIRGSWG